MSKIIKNGEYNDLIYALKSQIQSAQIKAAVSVNRVADNQQVLSPGDLKNRGLC
jgi:hypothetical protein